MSGREYVKNFYPFFPMFCFDPHVNITKPMFFFCFQGNQKGKLERKGLKLDKEGTPEASL